eukprot:m.37377 g.37377  ORF g.37377 m.37377 type:complete len:95 (-) comp10144_c0_seq10:3143-3427(-)
MESLAANSNRNNAGTGGVGNEPQQSMSDAMQLLPYVYAVLSAEKYGKKEDVDRAKQILKSQIEWCKSRIDSVPSLNKDILEKQKQALHASLQLS